MAAMAQRLSALVARLPGAATPKLVDGIWKKPRLSLRQINVARKHFIDAGRPAAEFPVPAREHTPMKWTLRPPKGRKVDRERPERERTVAKNLEKMPKLVEDWRKERRTAKDKTRTELPFKRGDKWRHFE